MPAPIDDGAGVGRQPGLEERLAAAGGRDEAHVLAVGLVGGGEAEPGGLGAHVGLGEVAHREPDAGQRRLVEHVDDVGLVLGGIGAAGHAAGAVGTLDDPGVVAGGHGLEAEGVGPAEQAVELEVAVALDARVGGAPGGVVGDVGRDDVLVEVVAEAEGVVLDAEAAGDGARIVDIGHRAAAGVGLASPELEGGADHLVAGLEQERRRDR